MIKKKLFFLLLLISVALGASASAQTKVRVKFAKGASSAAIKGRVTGYRYIDYVVAARAGQTLAVKINASNNFAQFVIFDPTMETLDDAAGAEEWTGELPSSGNYTVRVLLPRAEARRKTADADFTLRVSVR